MDTDAEGSVYIFLCFYLKGGEIIKHMNAEGKEIFTPPQTKCVYILGDNGVCVCIWVLFCFVFWTISEDAEDCRPGIELE